MYKTLSRAMLALELLNCSTKILAANKATITRGEQPAPHLGRITMRSAFDDSLAAPLPSAVDRLHLLNPNGQPLAQIGR